MSKANPAHAALAIARAAAGGPPSKEHKRFQDLLVRIDKARARLQAWNEQLPLFAAMYAERAGPLEARLLAERRAFAFELEQLLLGGKWNKVERQTLEQMICDVAGGLVDAGDSPDEELKALYNRHAEVDYDTEDELDLASMKGLVEAVSGVELGDDEVGSVDEMIQRARARLAEEAAAEHAARPPRRAHKTAAAKRAEAEAERATQTVREVYRKLAAALHPDRIATTASAEERAARTEQMARANAAYEAGDLLALLSLQLQIEQVDVAHAAGVAAEQVRHFNRVLAEQLAELEAEIVGREMAFCESYALMPERRPDPHKLGLLLKDEVRELQAAEAELARERRLLRRPLPEVKQYLKVVRQQQRLADMDDDFF